MVDKKDILEHANPSVGLRQSQVRGKMLPPAGQPATPDQNFVSGDVAALQWPIKIDKRKVRLLLVNENEQDVAMLQRLFNGIDSLQIDVDRVETLEAAWDRILRHEYDLCMTDYHLAQQKGIDLNDIKSGRGNNIPLILLKETKDAGRNLPIADSETTDCLEKAELTPELLKHCIQYAIERNLRVEKLELARKRLEELSAKIVDAQERERKIIGRELHDSIGSSLTAIRVAVESRKNEEGKDSSASAAISVEKILQMIDETIEETRQISEKLRPSILDDLGLVKTIGWLVRDAQMLHPDMQIRTHIEVTESDLPESLKIVIYRIIQEAFNNIAKHSNADAVDLTLTLSAKGLLTLEIQDNGKGFDPHDLIPAEEPGGHGLDNMRDRAEFSRGNLKIISEKGDGTLIRILWPITPNP